MSVTRHLPPPPPPPTGEAGKAAQLAWEPCGPVGPGGEQRTNVMWLIHLMSPPPWPLPHHMGTMQALEETDQP